MPQIKNFDDVINARSAGFYQDFMWHVHADTTSAGVLQQMPYKNGWYAASADKKAEGNCFSHLGLPGLSAGGYLFSANSPIGAARPYLTPPVGGRQKWLTMVTSINGAEGGLIADLLWACSQAYTVTASSIASPQTLRRYADGHGVQIVAWPSNANAACASGVTMTVTYINQDGVTGRTATGVFRANAERGLLACDQSMVFGGASAPVDEYYASTGQTVSVSVNASPFLKLQDDDTGVRAVTGINYAGFTGGNFVVALVRPLHWIAPGAGGYVIDDLLESVSGPIELPVGSDGQPACITVFEGATNAFRHPIHNVITRPLKVLHTCEV